VPNCDNPTCNESPNCRPPRLVHFQAHCSDCFTASLLGASDSDYQGYVLDGLGLGNGDDCGGVICLWCGKIQGEFPRVVPEKLDPECYYCGGECPHDEDIACNEYRDDVDNLYGKEVG